MLIFCSGLTPHDGVHTDPKQPQMDQEQDSHMLACIAGDKVHFPPPRDWATIDDSFNFPFPEGLEGYSDHNRDWSRLKDPDRPPAKEDKELLEAYQRGEHPLRPPSNNYPERTHLMRPRCVVWFDPDAEVEFLDVRREEKESFEHAFAEIDPVNVAFAKFRAPGDELLTPAEAIDGRVQYEGSLPVTHTILLRNT